MKIETPTHDESATRDRRSTVDGDQTTNGTAAANDAATTNKDEAAIDWQCFAYLTAEKSELYRAIIEVFAAAKSEFTLHLRPAQVRSSLNDHDFSLENQEVESALQSLESWGNLQSYQDNADVSSLADYYRKRLLYQLTAAGEAAHSSTLTFVQRLQQQAKLDARALDRIADGAGQLLRLALEIRNQTIHEVGPESDAKTDSGLGDHVNLAAESSAAVDSVVVLTTLRNVCQDADELTSRAQSFFRWLHEQTESDEADLQAFLNYKERLIEYLQEFVSQLISQGSVIARRMNQIMPDEFTQIATIAAREEMGLPRAGEEEQHESQIKSSAQRWQQRLLGLRSWFSRSGGKSAQLEQLRAAARAAIPRLLQLASQMNDRQSGRSDRVADLRELAIRFLGCKNDGEAHRLYRASFALSSSRHLKVEQATIDFRDQNPIRHSTRWIDAQPVEFSPQLRQTGRQATASANRRVVDRASQRAEAKRRISVESGRRSSARETLIALGKRRLSSIGELDEDAFRLLVELIELAAAKPMGTNIQQDRQRTIALSRDGSLRIETRPANSTTERPTANLDPKPNPEFQNGPAVSSANVAVADSISIATLSTENGTLMLPDLWLEVTRV